MKSVDKNKITAFVKENAVFIRIAVSVVLLAVGILASFPHGWIKAAFFAASAVTAGYDVIINAGFSIAGIHILDADFLVSLTVILSFAIEREADGVAAMILYRIGKVLVDSVVAKSEKAEGFGSESDIPDVTEEAPELEDSLAEGEPSAVRTETPEQRILRLVDNAEKSKGGAERKINRAMHFYAPAVFVLAIVVGVLIPLVFKQSFSEWLYRALVLLAMASPASVLISLPIAYGACMEEAGGKGILFKNASVVDTMADTMSVIYDKPGTLTTGGYNLIETSSSDIKRQELLMLAAYAEARSLSPIARSIVKISGISPDDDRITAFREVPGKGVVAEIGGSVTIAAGNEMLMADAGVMTSPIRGNGIPVYIAVNNRYAGSLLLGETANPEAEKAVMDLNALGIERVAMFSDDSKEQAEAFAGQLGIHEFYTESLPDERAEKLRRLHGMQLEGDRLVFVSGPLADPCVMRMADIGVSMCGGDFEEALETADVALITQDPSKIADAISVSRRTKKAVKQNMAVALSLKGIVFALALVGIASMWLAVIIDACISIITSANAARVSSRPAKKKPELLEAAENNVQADAQDKQPVEKVELPDEVENVCEDGTAESPEILNASEAEPTAVNDPVNRSENEIHTSFEAAETARNEVGESGDKRPEAEPENANDEATGTLHAASASTETGEETAAGAESDMQSGFPETGSAPGIEENGAQDIKN